MEMNLNEGAGAAAAGPADALPPGTVIGSRFQIEAFLGAGGAGHLYRAQDVESTKTIALRLFAADLCQDATVFNRLREQIRTASTLQHKNIGAVFGMGKEGQSRFVALEFVDGRSLRQLVAKKRAARKTFSLKGAYNVVAHVCNALHHAHATTCHGLLGPGAILVNRVGRVKVCDFGVAHALEPGSNAMARMGDRYCIAPEMELSPSSAGPAADIYSLGIVIYELLAGAPPSSPQTPVAQFNPSVPPAVDAVIERCLAADPSQRFSDAKEVKAAFYEAIGDAMSTPSASQDGLARDLPAAPGPAQARPAAPDPPRAQPAAPDRAQARAAAPPPAAPAPPQPAAPAQLAPQQRPGPPAAAPGPQPAQAGGSPLDFAPAPAQTRTEPPAAAPATPAVSIEELLAENSDDTEKWLIQKDRLDFGPFSMSDLKQQLYKGDFSGDDIVVDQETGERGRIRSHPEFREFIIHLERHLEAKRSASAEQERVQRDKRRRTIIVVVVFSCLAVLGAGGAAIYYMVRNPETREKIVYREKESDLASALKGIQITWKREPVEQRKKRRRNRRRKRRTGGGGGGGSDNVTRLGDVSQAGGDALLSQKKVQSVMQQNFNKLTPCVYQELRRSPGLRKVLIEFGVKGSGRVSSTKVNGKMGGKFHACIAARMRRIKFPSYDGVLTRASFTMSLK